MAGDKTGITRCFGYRKTSNLLFKLELLFVMGADPHGLFNSLSKVIQKWIFPKGLSIEFSTNCSLVFDCFTENIDELFSVFSNLHVSFEKQSFS